MFVINYHHSILTIRWRAARDLVVIGLAVAIRARLHLSEPIKSVGPSADTFLKG